MKQSLVVRIITPEWLGGTWGTISGDSASAASLSSCTCPSTDGATAADAPLFAAAGFLLVGPKAALAGAGLGGLAAGLARAFFTGLAAGGLASLSLQWRFKYRHASGVNNNGSTTCSVASLPILKGAVGARALRRGRILLRRGFHYHLLGGSPPWSRRPGC